MDNGSEKFINLLAQIHRNNILKTSEIWNRAKHLWYTIAYNNYEESHYWQCYAESSPRLYSTNQHTENTPQSFM